MDSFDLYVWRRCGHRVVMSAKASPRPELRVFVAWLDRLPEALWGELIGILKVSAGHAADWLMDHDWPGDYARQMLCVQGLQGPEREPQPLIDCPVIREQYGDDEVVYCDITEDVTAPQEPEPPGAPAPSRPAP